MKPALTAFLACTVAAAAFAQQPAAPAATPAANGSATAARKTDPFERTRKQIDALVGHRTNPPKFEPSRYNPFLIGALPDASGKSPEGDGTPVTIARPISSDETVLQQLSAQLKVTGYFRRDDRVLLVLNGTPRGEGDTIALPHDGGTATVRIKSIITGWYVLTYGKAELRLRY